MLWTDNIDCNLILCKTKIAMMETVVMALESCRFNTARRSDAFKFWAPSMAIVFYFEETAMPCCSGWR